MSGDPLRRQSQRCRTLTVPKLSGLFQALPSFSLGRRLEVSPAANNVGAKFQEDEGELTPPFPWAGGSRSQPPRLVWPLGNALSTKPPTSSTCHAQAAAATPLLVRGGLLPVPLVSIGVPFACIPFLGYRSSAETPWSPAFQRRGLGFCLPC